MIKLVFSGKCKGCTECDLVLEDELYPNELDIRVHCMHEKACERIEKLHEADCFYGPGGEGRRLKYE